VKTFGLVGVILVLVAASGGAFWKWHETPAFCGVCHVMDKYVASYDASEYLANFHASKGEICLDCHPFNPVKSASEAVKYVTGDYEDPLIERRLPQEQCFPCHEQKTYAEIIPLTADSKLNPHDSHFGELECGVCHKMHKANVYYCAQCKDVGPLPAGWVAPPGSKLY